MKILKRLLVTILFFAFLISLTSCYFISAQSMNKLKGTYKLTSYTHTPKHERKEGYTERTIDYVNDAEYKYEDYLVITGTDRGYYVHKDAGGESYVKEITLSYVYSQDDSSKVDYIIFNDSITVNGDEGGFNKLGVSKRKLNFTKAAFDYNELLTKKPMRSEAISIRWEKVDKATDLSFVNEQIGNMKYYKYAAFGVRGIYELSTIVNIETTEHIPSDQKYYIVLDTANGVTTADLYVCQSDNETTNTSLSKVSFSANDDFSLLSIDGAEWSLDTSFARGYYTYTKDNYKYTIRLVSNDISKDTIESLTGSQS